MSKRLPSIERSLLLLLCNIIIGVGLAYLMCFGLSAATHAMITDPELLNKYDTAYIWTSSVFGILYIAWAVRDIKQEIDNGY